MAESTGYTRAAKQQVFRGDPVTLTEGSVVERVARQAPALVDPATGAAGLLDSGLGRDLLTALWQEYAAAAAPFPIVIHTPTWRCGRDRMALARCPDSQPEAAGAQLIRQAAPGAIVAGLVGPRGDCYTPAEAPDREASRNYHAWQAERLAAANCDFLLAATLPSLGEALGIADAFAPTGLDYVLSFVLRADGCLLDGTALADAIAEIDRRERPPAQYWINCTHPEVLAAGLRQAHSEDAAAAARVRGFQANTSPRDPSEYDALSSLETMRPEDLAGCMVELRREFGLTVLGGCCGTRAAHIRALARALDASGAGRSQIQAD
jgi:homocysteine S-methyltransferase